MQENVLNAVNPLFNQYGIEELRIVKPSKVQVDDFDLPF